jgi:hypothetical protein
MVGVSSTADPSMDSSLLSATPEGSCSVVSSCSIELCDAESDLRQGATNRAGQPCECLGYDNMAGNDDDKDQGKIANSLEAIFEALICLSNEVFTDQKAIRRKGKTVAHPSFNVGMISTVFSSFFFF